MLTCRYLLIVLVLSLCSVSRGFADLMNVSINGSVSGIAVCQFTPNPVSSSFSGMNSQTGFGTYSLARSGGLGCSAFLGASDSANQAADVALDSLTVSTQVRTAAQGQSGVVIASANASSTLTIAFDLSGPSVMDLTGSLTNVCSAPFNFGCGSPFPFGVNASGSVQLTGPAVNITQTNGSFTLDSGHYVLVATNFASSNTDFAVSSSSTLSLDAEFTAIPEPRWLVVVPILWSLLRHRHLSRSSPEPACSQSLRGNFPHCCPIRPSRTEAVSSSTRASRRRMRTANPPLVRSVIIRGGILFGFAYALAVELDRQTKLIIAFFDFRKPMCAFSTNVLAVIAAPQLTAV